MTERHWYDWLWVPIVVSWLLPLYAIQFVWITFGVMAVSLGITLVTNSKAYCNKYCGRGQFHQLLGGRFGLSLNRRPSKFLRSRWFRLGFLALFLLRFGMLAVSSGSAAEAASRLDRMMFLTLIMGLSAMVCFRPRSWCVCCPMGTLMQEMCRARNAKEE